MPTRGLTDTYLVAADAARPLLDQPGLADRWEATSALELMSIGALTAHLSRTVTVLPGYLDSAAQPPYRDAPDYFVGLMDELDPDPHSAIATGVRSRAEAGAVAGPGALADRWDAARVDLEELLRPGEEERGIDVRGMAMTVEQYVLTRLVELVIHSDDLAVSLGAATPSFAQEAEEAVLGCLVEMGRRRSSAMEMIIAMSRIERGDGRVLRVF